MAKSNKSGARATIKYHPNLSCYSPGKRPAQFNPNFQVPHQNEPTSAHPVSQHKQFKGHSTGAGKVGKVPK